MVTARTFPDVVQERSEHEQVGPAHVPGMAGGVGHGLEQVPVHAPTVVGVELGPVTDMRPLGQVALPDPELVERLDGVDARRAHGQEPDEGP